MNTLRETDDDLWHAEMTLIFHSPSASCAFTKHILRLQVWDKSNWAQQEKHDPDSIRIWYKNLVEVDNMICYNNKDSKMWIREWHEALSIKRCEFISLLLPETSIPFSLKTIKHKFLLVKVEAKAW